MKRFLFAILACVATPLYAAATSDADTSAPAYISPDQAFEEVTKKAREVPTSEMDEDEVAAINRLRMLEQAGRTYGVQMGRYNRWQAQVGLFNKQAVTLDRGFPFGRLYLRNGTLQPPVLDSAEDFRAIEDDGRLRRLVDKSYRTLVQARFRNYPLTWRDFLLPENMVKPPLPRETLLPRTSDEREKWNAAMLAGWEEGRQMAIDEADLRVEALQRGFRGIVLYRLLALHGMIDPPQVIERDNGSVIGSDAGDELLIGVQEELISQDAYFVSQPGRWRAVDYGFVESGEKSR